LDDQFKIQQRIPSQHMPLGILEDNEFDASYSEFDLRPDNKVILYTDGILEACNQEGELFGRSRFESALQLSKCNIDVIRQELYQFMAHQVGEYAQDDDISLVCIHAGEIEFNDDDLGFLDENRSC
jgi:serine phosphatase RsbU (regulator of sigma subunit)